MHRERFMKKLWEKYGSQFIRFGCVGAVNTLVDMLVYWLTLLLLGNGAPLGEHNYLLAQLLGFVAGTLNAYFMNGKFVFAGADGKRKKDLKRLVRTFIGYGFTFALSELLLWVWIDCAGIPKLPAKLINLCVTVPLNFIINRFWTFRETE